jgi:hypothetical protein
MCYPPGREMDEEVWEEPLWSCQIKHNYVKTKVHIKCVSTSLIIPGVTGIGEGIVIELQLG